MATSRTASCFQGGVRFQDGTLQATAAFGTVTSVAMTGDGVIFNAIVGGSPITVSGTLTPALLTQTANRILAGPTSGGAATPTFRALVTADLPAGTGTVTSVALTAPTEITVGGSPITTSGTLALSWTNESANRVFAGPTTGAATTPTFRALVAADIPSLSYVTSIALAVPSIFSVSGSPITSSGTITIGLQTETANFVWAGPTTGSPATPTFRALVTADLPAGTGTVTSVAMTGDNVVYATTVGGSPITTSGTLVPALKTQTANTVFAGPTSGGAATPTFRALVAADISGLVSTAWSSLTAAAADLTLGNTTFNTTFNHTAATNWKWTNTTAATSSLNGLSPILSVFSQVWSNGADTQSGYSIQNKITTAPNSKSITNSSENASNTVTLTVGAAHGFVALQRVTFIGLTTMTWINSVTVIITSVTATTILFQDPTSHGTSASHADTGTTTLVPPMELTFTSVGTAGDTRMMFPVLGVANANVGVGGFGFIGQAANCGYGPISNTTGGFAVYTGLSGGGSSTSCFGIYRISAAPASNAPTQQVAVWEYGDNSDGNSTSVIQATVGGFSVGLQGSRTTATQTGNPCVIIGNSGGGSIVNTSQTMIGLGIGYGKATSTAFTFAPTSGTGVFQCAVIKYTVNQTGGANGSVAGLIINAVETAVGGTHTMLDIQSGTTGGTSRLKVDNAGIITEATANGANYVIGQASELLTLSTSGTTTDTAANLLPAGAIIDSVVCRVTTTITTATDWSVGDPTTAARFSSANATLTSGTTSVGLNQMSGAVTTLAAGPTQAAAAKVRITTTGTPGAGVIRITVFYRQFVAPTS